jgi:predicted 3-demethylubiquinone-9 3-methyltransferase (glyoxalase superfamily)
MERSGTASAERGGPAEGQNFTALNGGPHFKFNEAVSLVVRCQSQEEVDYYWNRLSEGGDPRAQQCGWLKNRFGGDCPADTNS